MSAAAPTGLRGLRAGPEPRVVVGINDLKTARAGTLFTIGLGSCIGVALWDPTTHVGGLCHYMMPSQSIDPARARTMPLMFGDTAIAALLQAFTKAGGRLETTIAYLAGGASINPGYDIFDVGQRNTNAAREALASAGLQSPRCEVGGRIARTLSLDVEGGLVAVSTPGLAVRSL